MNTSLRQIYFASHTKFSKKCSKQRVAECQSLVKRLKFILIEFTINLACCLQLDHFVKMSVSSDNVSHHCKSVDFVLSVENAIPTTTEDFSPLQETLKVGEDALEDNSIYDMGSTAPVQTLNRLWKFCESTESSVKLVLPDSLVVPYYLPRPKGMLAEQDPKLKEREQRRLVVMTTREVQSKMNRQTKSNYYLPHATKLSPREERIRQQLMNQYESEPEHLREILHRYRSKQLTTKKTVKLKAASLAISSVAVVDQPTIHQDDDSDKEGEMTETDTFDDHHHNKFPTAATVTDSLRRASIRRSSLIQEEHHRQKGKLDKWQDKINDISTNRESLSSYVDLKLQRETKWVVIIQGLLRLQKMHEIVDEERNKKVADRKRWFAQRTLQRFFRFIFNRKKGIENENSHKNLVKRLRRSMAGNEEVALYNSRVDATTVIINILRSTRREYKVIVHQYARKIKFLQRRVRQRLTINHGRFLLMNLYLERLLTAFNAYCSTVVSGKGNDLGNLNAMDKSRLRVNLRPLRDFPLARQFDSAAFHALIRQHRLVFAHTNRFLGAAKHAVACQIVNVERMKKEVLLSLLFKKRLQASQQRESYPPVVIPTQTITAADTIAFIRGERDPVLEYLLEVEKVETEYKQKYHQHREQSKTGKVYHKYSGHETCLLLIHQITVEEFAMAIRRITELALAEFDRLTSTGRPLPPNVAAAIQTAKHYNNNNHQTAESFDEDDEEDDDDRAEVMSASSHCSRNEQQQQQSSHHHLPSALNKDTAEMKEMIEAMRAKVNMELFEEQVNEQHRLIHHEIGSSAITTAVGQRKPSVAMSRRISNFGGIRKSSIAIVSKLPLTKEEDGGPKTPTRPSQQQVMRRSSVNVSPRHGQHTVAPSY